MTTKKIITTIAFALFITVTLFTVGNIYQYFDIASFIVVIIIAILYSISAKGDGGYIQKFGDGTVRAGWLGSLIGVVAILGSPVFAGSTSSLEALGAALAIASLTVLYGYFFKLGSIILD